ncbi:MAG: Mur ligase family protein, partial [Dehalococcoidia bacterium]|nr:Mur ligase family protein [Dehalococcoidia bacterium]
MTANYYSPDLTFEQAVDMAMSLADFERSANWPGHSFFHLERVQMLAECLDDVDKAVPTIHVAGTKGKGSTCALITSILTQAGYKVGLFTSPHLHSVCERVRVGLEPISTTDYAALIGQIWPAVESVARDGKYGGVSFFEMLTGLAMLHYRNIGADFQVLEVGMGGKLDSTNIVTPELSVITSISLDHVNVLGDTIEKIASAKAGIIKEGVPCVIGPQAENDAMRVFEQVTQEQNSRMISTSDRFTWETGCSDIHGQDITLTGINGAYCLRTPLLGDYQAENVATAVAAIETLKEKGYDIPNEAISAGVREVSWPGRFEVYRRSGKTIVADGAHNPYSIGRLVQNLRS